MPSRPPAVSRRAVLGVLALGAAGCSVDSLDPTSDDPTFTPSSATSPGPSTPSTRATEPDDDAVVVTQVLAALALAHRTARANARTHRALAPTLRLFERLHLTHADELGDLPRSTGRVADPSEAPAAVLARVDRAESRLQDVLVDAAAVAGSGALAQTLAAMAAGTAQLRTTLATGRA